MIRDAAFLNDVFDAMKSYVPKAELGMAAEDLVRIFDDYGMSEGFTEEPTLNSKLKSAIKMHFDLEESGNDDDEYTWSNDDDDD